VRAAHVLPSNGCNRKEAADGRVPSAQRAPCVRRAGSRTSASIASGIEVSMHPGTKDESTGGLVVQQMCASSQVGRYHHLKGGRHQRVHVARLQSLAHHIIKGVEKVDLKHTTRESGGESVAEEGAWSTTGADNTLLRAACQQGKQTWVGQACVLY
jgi:hypothetical protein